MPKNILIFSDGTGQAGGLTPDQNISNIYKLYRATRCGPENNIDPSRQLTFYDPGLGSQPDSGLFFVTRAKFVIPESTLLWSSQKFGRGRENSDRLYK